MFIAVHNKEITQNKNLAQQLALLGFEQSQVHFTFHQFDL
jgi:hypothetical protein